MYLIGQYGSDGFGHQLYGTMTLMALHNEEIIEFVEYIKPKQFQHSNKESTILNLFLVSYLLISKKAMM